jgi:hypothetical protein
VTITLKNHYAYLRKNLPMSNDLATKLYGWSPQLLADSPYHEIRALNNLGRHFDAFEKWFEFATSFYTEDSIRALCKCLKEAGREGRSKLTKVAMKTLKKVLRGYVGSPQLSPRNSPEPDEKVSYHLSHVCTIYSSDQPFLW